MASLEEALEKIKSRNYSEQSPEHPYAAIIGWKEGGWKTVCGFHNQEDAESKATEEFDPDSYVIIWSRFKNLAKVGGGKIENGTLLEE